MKLIGVFRLNHLSAFNLLIIFGFYTKLQRKWQELKNTYSRYIQVDICSGLFTRPSKHEYSNSNFIEFFNNIDYLDLLATTNIAYKLTPWKTTPLKAAYEYDLENLKRIGFRRKSLLKLEKRFSRKKKLFQKLKKFRSGIIIGS